MDQNHSTVSMLHMFTHPVFTVENGLITEVNAAGQQLGIRKDIAVSALLATGQKEYAVFSGGALSLTLRVSDIRYIATVLRSESSDIFHLHSSPVEADLRSLALTAQCMREPLANIMTLSDQLFDPQALEEKTRHQAAQMNKSTYQLLRILSNMTDAATCKDRTYNMEMLDLSTVFRSAAQTASELIGDTGKTLKYEGLWDQIYSLCDADMLERAFFNLISNAIKYSPQSSTIHVSLTKANDHILLTVKNPFDKFLNADLGTIFARYRREPGLEDGRNGIGLGIPMVRAAAAAHDGTLLLTQDSAKNVIFTLSIAVRTENSDRLRCRVAGIDYAGGRNHGLLELSDVLPAPAYENVN